MKAKGVVIGETYLTKIGNRLARVVVVCLVRGTVTWHRTDGRRNPDRFQVRAVNGTKPLPKYRTAAALRPLKASAREAMQAVSELDRRMKLLAPETAEEQRKRADEYFERHPEEKRS